MSTRTVLASFVLALPLLAQGWPNAGGNAARNGYAPAIYGPIAPQVRWSGSASSIIAWQPVIEGDRVFCVRQTGFPPGGEPNGSTIYCQSLSTGQQQWFANIPFNTGDWTTWIAGVRGGRVFASRAGNGASVAAKIHALDAGSGANAWISQEAVDAGAYDGVVFAPNGDLIVGSFRKIWRIRWSDGTTAWSAARTGSVSGNCGAAISQTTAYVADAAAGGTVIKAFDLATGAFRYQTSVMPGFTIQNSPFVGAGGLVLLSRTQNNAGVDYLYCFKDTGTALVSQWNVGAAWTTGAGLAASTDVFHVAPGGFLERLDASGARVAISTLSIGSGALTPQMAIDRDHRLFVSNGQFATGQLFCFEPDLSLRWSVPALNVNIGAPALGDDGTLVVALTGTNMVAYRTPPPWTSLGGAISGTLGVPVLTGDGTLTPARPFALTLTRGNPGENALLVIGASALNLPYLGGTLVPRPDLVWASFAINAQGGATTPFVPWPAGTPPGTRLWFQMWFLDPAAPFGVAASNGLEGKGQ